MTVAGRRAIVDHDVIGIYIPAGGRGFVTVNKTICAAAVLLFAGFMAWLLWPLADARWAIREDRAMLERKREYLDRLRREPRDASSPNVVIILADDLGTQDISLYGGTVPTPRIDAVAREGVVFTSAYCASPICSPSRASLLTGRAPQRYGYEFQPMTRYPRNRLEYTAYRLFVNTGRMRLAPVGPVPRAVDIREQGLPLTEITLAEALGNAGYRTGIAGKWHLGYGGPRVPERFGFDFQYGFNEAFSLYAPVDDPRMVNVPLDDFADRHIWSGGRDGHCAIRRDGRVVKEREYLTDAIAREAVNFIGLNRNRPFFLYVSFSAPHTPFQAPRELFERANGNGRKKRAYAAIITSLDNAVGRIVDELDRHGLSRNTLVFFASDNGAATYTGAPEEGVLKSGKFSYFEGGLRVPMALRWPAAVRPGTVEPAPVSLMDAYMTSVAAARCPLPGDRAYDGVDLVPHVTGRAAGPPHDTLCWRDGRIRVIRRGGWKLIIDGYTGREFLYDIPADPSERRNLAGSRPDIVTVLRETHTRWERETARPPRWPHVMFYRFTIDGEDILFPL